MIWLIGGTSESVILAKAIAALNINCTITVTTENARSLYKDIPLVKVIVGTLELYDLSVFLRKNKIQAIVDASHPFANQISEYAIDTSQELNIPYLRFERKTLKFMESKNVIYLESFTILIEGDYLINSRALITVGFTDVNLFKPLHRKATLFARLLPAMTPFRYIFEAGFSPENIIAIRPPVTEEFERALWQMWNIDTVVTKASGSEGGEDIKYKVAQELGVKLIIIQRPEIEYPQQTSNIKTVCNWVAQHLIIDSNQ